MDTFSPSLSHKIRTLFAMGFNSLRCVFISIKERWMFPCVAICAKFYSVFLNGFCETNYAMSGLIHKFKIINPIVELVSVFMVNNLFRSKYSPKMFFHYQPMFVTKFAIDSEDSISRLGDTSTTINEESFIGIPPFTPTHIMFEAVSFCNKESFAILY